MAPVGLLHRIKNYYSKDIEKDLPAISSQSAAVLSIVYTLIYVVPFYVSSATRPSPQLSRDAPSVIRARIRVVTLSCMIISILTLYVIVSRGQVLPVEGVRLLGWWPAGVAEIIKPTLLTTILFAGPLFEKGVAEGGWRDWIQGKRVAEVLGGWIGWRNFIAGPITEEIVFRSCLIPLHLLAKISPTRIVFYTPLYFGIAHIHHCYEYALTHPHTPLLPALGRSLFQFGYTSVFGFYAAFIYLRTGSLIAVILCHSFCNWCGLPRLWGKVEAGVPLGPPTERKDDGEGKGVKERMQVADGRLGIGWTVAYYVFLAGGALGFWWGLWALTDSSRALVSFGGDRGVSKR